MAIATAPGREAEQAVVYVNADVATAAAAGREAEEAADDFLSIGSTSWLIRMT
jgi:hypothetical protein